MKNKVVFSSELEIGTMGSSYEFNLTGLNGIPVTANTTGIRIGEIYPNPFDATASLDFVLDKPGKIEGKIINELGKVIQVVINQEMEPGSHVLQLNGEMLPPGLYTLLMTYSNSQTRSVISKKMIIK